MPTSVFLSCVSSEFRSYRAHLAQQLGTVEAKVHFQEHFQNEGGPLLFLIDSYIQRSDYIVHLIGSGVGARPESGVIDVLLNRYPRFAEQIGAANPYEISYTQWEFWLGWFHKKKCLIFTMAEAASREDGFVRTADQDAAQEGHLNRICALGLLRDKAGTAWELSSKVLISLINLGGRPDQAQITPNAGPPPAIVIALTPTSTGHALSAGVRWRGQFVCLSEPTPLDVDDREAITGRLTELISSALNALPARETGGQPVMVELALPTALLFERLDKWCFQERDAFGTEVFPLHRRFPVRLRSVDRPSQGVTARNLLERLQLLESRDFCVDVVGTRIPVAHFAQRMPPPVAMVHENEGESSWAHPGIVCGAFARPPVAERRRVRTPVRKTPASPIRSAMRFGIPFLVWPDRQAVTVTEMEQHLKWVGPLENLCHYFYAQATSFAVLAESRDPFFPEAPPMVSTVGSES